MTTNSKPVALNLIDSLVKIFEDGHKSVIRSEYAMEVETNVIIDCDKVATILNNDNVNVDAEAMRNTLTKYKYCKDQLVHDLCDVLFLDNAKDTLLSKIFINEFNITDQCLLKRVYNMLMYRYLKQQDLNNCNFIKVLTFTALSANPAVNVDEIKKIATKHNLSGALFIMKTKQFLNRLKFAKLFKAIEHYNKKEWNNIYITIKNWIPIVVSNAIDEKECGSIVSKPIPIVYSFGMKYWYDKWPKPLTECTENVLVKAHFDSLKEEVIANAGKILLDKKRWDIEMKEALNNLQRKECKKYCINTKGSYILNIKPNTVIGADHLIAVQLYCNFTVEQGTFSKTYRMDLNDHECYGIRDDKLEIIRKQHSFYANWGRLLYEAVNVFGNRPWENTYFVHCVDKEMLFKKTTTIHIYGPLSTTVVSNKRVVIEKFAGGGNGMAIKVDATMNNCFDCKWISEFKDEKEFLFIGSKKPFRITNVWIFRTKLQSLGKYMKAINMIIEGSNNIIGDDVDFIKTKLLEMRSDIAKLSFEDLQHNLEQFASAIMIEKYNDNIRRASRLRAVEWIVKLFHCYLMQQ